MLILLIDTNLQSYEKKNRVSIFDVCTMKRRIFTIRIICRFSPTEDRVRHKMQRLKFSDDEDSRAKKPKEARDVNVKHHRGALQIEQTGFRCRMLEIRMSPTSTFTILLFLAATSYSLFSFPNNVFEFMKVNVE